MAEFVGSKISLVTHKNVRYEGILEQIDPVRSIVCLKSVELFGTEGRDCDQFVPPKIEIEPFMMFNGDDIKDLTIVKPKADDTDDMMMGGGGFDVIPTSIVEDVPQMPTYVADSYAPASGYPMVSGGDVMNSGYTSGGGKGGYYGSSQNNFQGNLGQREMSNYNNNMRGHNNNNNYYYGNNNNNPNNNGPDNNRGGYNNVSGGNNYNSRHQNDRRGQYGNPRGGRGGRGGNQNNNNNQHNNQQRGERRWNFYHGNQNDNVGVLSAADNAAIKEKMEVDFDFAANNELFSRGNDHPVAGAGGSKYDKTTSFFDSISCEALNKPVQNRGDPQEARSNREKQRAVDVETFGESSQPVGRGFGGRRRRGGYNNSGRGSRGQNQFRFNNN